MANTISIPKVVDPGVKKHFVDGYNLSKVDLGLIFNVGNQTSETDEFKNYTGLTSLASVGQGEAFTEDSPIEAYGLSLTPVKYGKLMPVTYEMRKWSKAREIWDGAKHLGKAAARTEQAIGADVLNNAFTSTVTSLTDGVELCDSAHPRADGGASQSNVSALAFSDTNLEVLTLMMEGQLDDRGQLIEAMPDKIVIPPALRKSVLQVLKSNGQADTADNNVNVYNTLKEYYGTLKIVVWDYLGAAAGGSDTAWFLMDDSLKGLMWQWAEKASVSRDESVGFKTDTVYYKSRDYFSYGWRDWRGIVGSTGV